MNSALFLHIDDTNCEVMGVHTRIEWNKINEHILCEKEYVATSRYCKEHDTGPMWADVFRVVDAASQLGLGNELAACNAAEVGCTPYQIPCMHSISVVVRPESLRMIEVV